MEKKGELLMNLRLFLDQNDCGNTIPLSQYYPRKVFVPASSFNNANSAGVLARTRKSQRN